MKNNETQTAQITALSHDGRGIAHLDGKTIFIDGALPDETVTFNYTKKHSKFDEGKVNTVLTASPNRVAPQCKHFGICNGCSLQHLAHAQQIELKQKNLLEQLQHFGGVIPTTILPPLIGPIWNYRSKARLGVKYVAKKSKVLVGFHEKNGRFLADIEHCPILHASISDKINLLSELIAKLSIFQAIPQIEVAATTTTTGLIFRHLQPLSATDIELLKDFGATHNFRIFLQPQGRESIHCINHEQQLLAYNLPNLELLFHPADFTQINATINNAMVARVLEMLQLQPQDQVLDLFCGLGNFTLPLAAQCKIITGIEGDTAMVQRATANAAHNNIANANFYAADLARDAALLRNESWTQHHYDKILLDPPRTGALEIIKLLPQLKAQIIVYVSCNPATLARDAKELVAHKYHLQAAGIIDMFPHTSHVESVALFIRQ